MRRNNMKGICDYCKEVVEYNIDEDNGLPRMLGKCSNPNCSTSGQLTSNIITEQQIDEHIKYWRDEIYRCECADDFYYSNGGYRNDSRQLKYWEDLKEKIKKN